MIKIFFIIIGLFCLLGFLFGFSVLRMMFKAIFGIKPDTRQSSSRQQKSNKTNDQKKSSSNKKVFSHDEGEYIDYEEIKE